MLCFFELIPLSSMYSLRVLTLKLELCSLEFLFLVLCSLEFFSFELCSLGTRSISPWSYSLVVIYCKKKRDNIAPSAKDL